MSNPNVPASIGIIMDGNRRWAKERGVPTLQGHRAGLAKLKEVTRWAFEAGVGTIYYYAFSTENWNRAAEEVSYLIELFSRAIQNEFDELKTEGIRVRFIGDLARFPESLQKAAAKLQEETKENKKGTLALCISYGSRAEVVTAVNSLLVQGLETVTEESLRKALWSGDLPDPDLIIRTSGEKRLSNFLMYQAAYSELAFTDTKWPDFSKEELYAIFEDYASRERRRGK
ncbi:MAG TPA: polyprenyl diphosphate synthase [Candidatus Paceibacterota bacterium]|nr:polyprenyl diphosphate synthase [Candidatus Paceibacterota bacterium]